MAKVQHIPEDKHAVGKLGMYMVRSTLAFQGISFRRDYLLHRRRRFRVLRTYTANVSHLSLAGDRHTYGWNQLLDSRRRWLQR